LAGISLAILEKSEEFSSEENIHSPADNTNNIHQGRQVVNSPIHFSGVIIAAQNILNKTTG
jgi:hypothetical protein